MDPITITRALLRAAKEIAQDELGVPSADATLAVFYRLCIKRDRIYEKSWTEDQRGSEGPIH